MFFPTKPAPEIRRLASCVPDVRRSVEIKGSSFSEMEVREGIFEPDV